jgi:hypothetical protein
MKKNIFILLIFSLHSFYCFSQTDRWADCKPIIKNYNIYLQPKSIPIDLNKILSFHVVFEGNRDYIISFCVSNLYYPVHVRLLKLETGEEIYDNAKDNYPITIGVGIANTQSLIIEITLLANKLSRSERRNNDKVYVGLFMNWKKNVFNYKR